MWQPHSRFLMAQSTADTTTHRAHPLLTFLASRNAPRVQRDALVEQADDILAELGDARPALAAVAAPPLRPRHWLQLLAALGATAQFCPEAARAKPGRPVNPEVRQRCCWHSCNGLTREACFQVSGCCVLAACALCAWCTTHSSCDRDLLPAPTLQRVGTAR